MKGAAAMTVASKIAGLIEALRHETDAFAVLPPAERRHVAALCRFIADKADPPDPNAPKAGVLADLKNGARAE
jgi:hypothetical protein